MTADELRERLAEALYLDPAVSFTAEERKAAANVLAPVVREYADQRAAEELRKAADDEDLDRRYVRRWLRARADALDGGQP